MGKNGTLNDGLNEYQLVKKTVKVENNTVSGSVKRHRVSDQTVFDKMFIEGLLKIHHHEAAHMFIDDLARSGSSVPSVDLTKINVSTGTKGSSVAEKRMIFSNSFRSISEHSDKEDLKLFMRASNSPYDSGYMSISSHMFETVADRFTPILERLASHYNIKPRRDPREIIFSQMYRTVPKKHI